jgi:SAM-dependent methyltransferase
MEMQLDQLGRKYGLLKYHVPYLKQFLSVYDVRGKDILEVGGAMPREIVIDCMGSNSWTCTESSAYDEELGAANQQTLSGSSSNGTEYVSLLQNVEDFAGDHDGQFDCIFSIACFEHIAKFPEALDAMHRCLKPGGFLFSMYSPLWSSHQGHHLYHVSVPERFGAERQDGQILQPWEHLLKNRVTLYKDLRDRFDRIFADEVIYNVYNSPHINRYYTEDFIHFINESKFKVNQLLLSFQHAMPDGYQSALELSCPGYRSFNNQGIYLLMTK